ncbi:MAG: CRISPR-associated endonuclease Cas2 [Clostridia bacterium]|nr:CRISPR-associated endonuclease Cas2 [Clostridia bacterium]
MMVLISYDVETLTSDGKSRLRRVAKALESYAQRVQNSVFEADLDYAVFLKLKDKLLKVIDEKSDSLRFYYLGNHWHNKVEHFGVKAGYDPEGLLLT